jgi:hypothetical protein
MATIEDAYNLGLEAKTIITEARNKINDLVLIRSAYIQMTSDTAGDVTLQNGEIIPNIKKMFNDIQADIENLNISYTEQGNIGNKEVDLTDLADNNIVKYDSISDKFVVGDGLDTKQDLLVSGTNIKSINGESILGSGNLVIEEAGNTVLQSEVTLRDGRSTVLEAKAITSVLKGEPGSTINFNVATIIEEDEVNGTDINDGVIGLHSTDGGTTFTTQPYYFIADIPTDSINEINTYYEDSDIPTGTDIKRLISFDDGATWYKSDYVIAIDPDGANNTSTTTATEIIGADNVGTTDKTTQSSCYDTTHHSGGAAFDGQAGDTYNYFMSSSNNAIDSIEYEFGTPLIANKFIFTPRNYSNISYGYERSPASITVYGSTSAIDDNPTYTLLGTADTTAMQSNIPVTFTIVNSTIYKSYKFEFPANNGYTSIGDIAIIEAQLGALGTGALTPTSLENIQRDGHNKAEIEALLNNYDVSAIDNVKIAYDLSTTDSAVTPTINTNTSYLNVDSKNIYLSAIEGTDYTISHLKAKGTNTKIVSNISGSNQDFLINYV